MLTPYVNLQANRRVTVSAAENTTTVRNRPSPADDTVQQTLTARHCQAKLALYMDP